MSIGFAQAHAEIARAALARDCAERIVGVLQTYLPENADPVAYWSRIRDMAEDAIDYEQAKNTKSKYRGRK